MLCFYVKFQIIFAIIGLSNRIRILSECALRFSRDCVSSGYIQMVKRFLTSHYRLVYSLNIMYTCVWKEAHSKIKLVIFHLSTLGSSMPLLFSSVNVDDQELTFQVFTFLLPCLMTFALCGEVGDWIPVVLLLGRHLVQRCRDSRTCTGMQLSLINPTWIQVTLCFLASRYLGIHFVLHCIPLVLTYVQYCLGFFSFLWTGLCKANMWKCGILNFKEMKWNTVVFALFEIIKDKL